MVTEINFLEEKSNRNSRLLLYGLIFLVLVILAGVLIFIQRNGLESRVEQNEQKIAETEARIISFQDEHADARQLQQVLEDLAAVQAERVPVLEVYDEALNLMEDEARLSYFSYGEEGGHIIEAEFQQMEGAAAYLEQLQNSPYVTNVQLDSLSREDEGFYGIFSFKVDEGEWIGGADDAEME
ncbi:PilN domain-containing protein [Virgibacillus xinjiangensis]|uniref:PilN domain-containing protein n=1 Tax=Virgibacillus xinjiangensis TaxID=393090 RepID=A0ABV7CUZ5_9BACI